MSDQADTAERVAAFLAPLVDADRLIRDIDEPLRRSAPVAFATALKSCESGGGGADCRAYHAVREYLRLADELRAIRIDGPLFVAAAERLARDGRLKRGPISAAADYSMLAHIAHGAWRGGTDPSFDVVDRCATTLRMNEWYAAERSLDVATFQSDIFAFQPGRQYDLICTHSFLTFHPFALRAALFRRWRDWLAPGGRLCFSNTVSEYPVLYDAAARDRRIRAMTIRALDRLSTLGMALPCPEPEFVDLIRGFGHHSHVDQPPMSLATIGTWIAEAGLELELVTPIKKVLPNEEDPPLFSNRGAERPRIWFQIRRP